MLKSFEDCRMRVRQFLRMALFTTALTSATLASAAAEGTTIFVRDVDELYAALDPANNHAGAVVVLAPGLYTLSAKDALGADRPNGGRLDLQLDMSLSGLVGDRSAVVIDPGDLLQPSFAVPFGRTGVIRAGRGRNTIEWLTIAGNRFAAAAIETDLVQKDEAGQPSPTVVRIAHVVAGNISRGVDIRNVAAAMAGRRLEAEIEDSEFFWAVEGIRVTNFQGADGGKITVAMRGNRSYANRLGCIIENNRSSSASISVVSSGDRFDDNGLGCLIGGGLVGNLTGIANDNMTKFDAHGSQFTNNNRTEFNPDLIGPEFVDKGGLLATGGHALQAADSTNRNAVVVRLWDARIADNQPNNDFEAFGARLAKPPGVAGKDNHVLVQLRGVSKLVEVVAVDSEPPDPDGSNTVTVVRIP